MANPDKQTYSILVLGRTFSGKSTLIQHIKKYADPNYSIDMSFLGNDMVSKTSYTQFFHTRSNLPKYEVYQKATGNVIDLEGIANMCNDEDEYIDLLRTRNTDVEMRLAPHDSNAASEILEFQFLDTPGMNDTEMRDEVFATDILEQIIIKRSFNLILIVVSTLYPLSMEHGFTLEYYAKVLEGLHSNIAFLYTHVDYAYCHHSNTTYHANMATRHQLYSNIFRERKYLPISRMEHSTKTEDAGQYKYFTIDLTSVKRPIIQCLIRNTLREILQLAVSNPPEVLDTSTGNIDRIKSLVHPDSANRAYRDRFTGSLPVYVEDPQNFEELFVNGYTSDGDQDVKDVEQINILLIGDFRSGKTSLVETFKLYADPAYVAVTDDIGNREEDTTNAKVKITTFLVDLHTIQIHKLNETTGAYDVVDLEDEAKRLSEEDFIDLLNLDAKRAETVIIASNGAIRYRLNIYEGPSLNEGALDFEKNIFSIHKTLVDSKAELHQVLFTLAPGPLIGDIKATIRVCSDIFSDLNPLFSFVHTKIDYPKLHVGNKQFQDYMKERTELLQRYIQSSAAPYMIDCNLQSNWPVQRAKTYNVVHDILKTAIEQPPMALKSPLMKKTPKMVSIDANLKWQARDAFQETQKENTQNNKDLLELRGKIRQLNLDYKTKDQEVNSAKSKEDVATRDDMEVVFEDTFSAAAEPYPEIYSKTMTFKQQPRMVEKVHMVYENVEIEQALGGEGFNHWNIIYRRISSAVASLVVKLYAKKQDSAGNPVGETEELAKIRRERLDLEKQLSLVEERIRSNRIVQKEYNLLRDWISRETLPKAMMEELTKAEVYEAKETPFDKIKEIYLKSGGVYDTGPCEPAVPPTDVPQHEEVRCEVCGEKRCNKPACLAMLEENEPSLKEIYLKSGGVHDTGPCEPAVPPTDVPQHEEVRCEVCGEKRCNRPGCLVILGENEPSLKEIYLKSGGVYDTDPCEPGNTHYSVLMFGKTQAGKSTFIEFVKNYASQHCLIDESLIGNGFWSKTEDPIQFAVHTNLPVYEVFDSNGTWIDIRTLGDQYDDSSDYLDAIRDKMATLRPVPHNPDTSQDFVEITFLDTPGIEDTSGRDVDNAPKIIKAMARMQTLNLIIVIINCEDAPSKPHQLAFNYYSKVIHAFQRHHSNIVFVYTHADYEKCHHSNADHLSAMALRHKAFSQLFRACEQSTDQGLYSHECISQAMVDLYPMYNIDFARRQRPIMRCMQLMTLREILAHVVRSPAVVLDTSPSNMEQIENIPHPDKLNKMQQKKILKTTRTILKQGQEPRDCSDAPAVGGTGLAQTDSANNAGDDDRVTDQTVIDHDENCADYFRGQALIACSDSEEEGKGDDRF